MVGVVAVPTEGALIVVKDDDFIDAEDGQGAGDGAGQKGFLFGGVGTIRSVFFPFAHFLSLPLWRV